MGLKYLTGMWQTKRIQKIEILQRMTRFRDGSLYLKTLRFLGAFRMNNNTWNEVLQDMEFHNGVGTSNRHPRLFSTWMEYWRGFTETYHDEVRCCVCGCKITSSMTDEEIEKSNALGSSEEVRRACGAHVEINAGSKLYYIAPMCDKCNLERKKIVIKAGTKVVPEIAPIIR